MAEEVERVTQVVEPEVTGAQRTTTTRQSAVTARPPSGMTIVVRVISYLLGLLEILLAFRFVLVLLGANVSNAFAHFIFSVTYPFVAPFFSLFDYTKTYGVHRFETYTLVAMAVYAIVGWGIIKLITIAEPEQRV